MDHLGCREEKKKKKDEAQRKLMSHARTNFNTFRLLEQTVTVTANISVSLTLQDEEMPFVVGLVLGRGGGPKQDAGLILSCLFCSCSQFRQSSSQKMTWSWWLWQE